METARRRLRRSVAIAFAALAGISLAAQPARAQLLGTYQVAGQILTVTGVDTIPLTTTRITSCGQGVLYAIRISKGVTTLWFNKTRGANSWTQVTAGAPGDKIACDRLHLYALNGSTLYHATTNLNGQLSVPDTGPVWTTSVGNETLNVPSGTDEIASGLGNIYALAFNTSTHVGTLYSSQLHEATSPQDHTQGADWTMLANNLGANRATGAGSKAWFSSYTNPAGLPSTKRNRAFAANPDDTLYYNDHILDGINTWSGFPNAGVNILQISAEDSHTLYALTVSGSGRKIVRYAFSEGNCTDGLDNDANGLTDAEDSSCRRRLSTAFCTTHTGSYCIDRIQSTNGYDHALVTCRAGGQPPLIEAGVCTHASTAGTDQLAPTRANNEPYDSGHYCSVIHADGTWDFAWTGDAPCTELLKGHPGAFIARAGIYSKSETNNVFVHCNNGNSLPADGAGIVPLVAARAAVGHTANRCVFTVSPKNMRVFNAPFPILAWSPPSTVNGGTVYTYGRGYKVGHVFDHAPRCQAGDAGCPCASVDCTVLLRQFGNGDEGSTDWLDNRGKRVSSYQKDQNAYDYVMNEGVPLRSLGYGRVVANGSRDRDVSGVAGPNSFGTPYQGELYIRYDVGTNPLYRESFIAYYGHVGQRVVVSGQTVTPGQLVGYLGTTGSSSGPHVHFGLIRLTNTNGRKTGPKGEAFGYKVSFAPTTTAVSDIGFTRGSAPGTIDPYGWRSPAGQDPMAYWWHNAATGFDSVIGIGAWSPRMWSSTEETPPYPPED